MTRLYNLGPFRLDPAAGVLSRDGVPVALGARAVAVLAALVAREGEFIGKSDIMESAWPGMVVEEGNLAVQVTMLRRALAQASGGAAWIETLAKRGYRYAGPVAAVEATAVQDTSGNKASNLPASLTSFIGREEELARMRELLPRTRLLTLAGIGGIGKTRLALHAARELAGSFRDGVWFVDLAPLSDPALVASAVAQVLGVQEAAGKPLVDALTRQLKGSHLLLILDNCEHLLEACAKLVEALLGACAGVTILATSREPLNISGEQTWLLPTLSLPDPEAGIEAIAQSEAVQLFVARTKLHRLDFALTPARAKAVAQICVRLDGIALAIELAAARVRSFTVEEIHTRLDDRFALLTGGARTALPRQQTLRAALDWSHDLLTEEERTVFRHLAVFHGSFTLDAAMAVASTDSIGQFAVTDLVSQLVARSMLVVDTTSSGARYHFLETPRAYAREKLDATGEALTLQRRHVQYFRDLFERSPTDWLSMSDVDWRALYPPELENVRAALDWAFSPAGDPALGIALAGAAGPMWLEMSLHGEGKRRIELACSRIAMDSADAHHARLWLWLAFIWGRGSPDRSLRAAERAIPLYRAVNDAAGLGLSLILKSRAYSFMGRADDAAPILAEVLPLLENAGYPKALGHYYEAAGNIASASDQAAARRHYEEALRCYRSSGAERGAPRVLGSIADLAWTLGDLDAALAGFSEAAELMRDSPFAAKSTLGFALGNIAGIQTQRGDLNAAWTALREGLPLLTDGGYAWALLDHVALLAALAGRYDCAAQLIGLADAAHNSKQTPRQPNEAATRTRVLALLAEKYPAPELEALLTKGASLSEEEACQLALEN